MPVKVKGRVYAKADLDNIMLNASHSASMSAEAVSIGGTNVTVNGKANVAVIGQRVVIMSPNGAIEVAAPEIILKTEGSTLKLTADGISLDGLLVRLNCG